MINNPMQMIQEFLRFKQQFTGDPKQEVMRLVQSGQISQAQLNDLQQSASIFQNMLNGLNKRN